MLFFRNNFFYFQEKYIIIIIWREKDKISKQSKIITQQLKAIENPNIVDVESVSIEHQKISDNLSKTVRQTEKVVQIGSGKSCPISPLYSEIIIIFLIKENVKIKQLHAFKG